MKRYEMISLAAREVEDRGQGSEAACGAGDFDIDSPGLLPGDARLLDASARYDPLLQPQVLLQVRAR